MNFKNWKIVDVDNFMEGNHYFSNIVEEDVWNKGVTNLLGGPAKIWKEEQVSSPLFFQDVLKPEMHKIIDRFDGFDTRSNRKMSPLHKQKEEILRKMEEAVETAK
jgi:hypothetical protein